MAFTKSCDNCLSFNICELRIFLTKDGRSAIYFDTSKNMCEKIGSSCQQYYYKTPSRNTDNMSKGGKARAESLAPERRSEIAKHAANIRWNRE